MESEHLLNPVPGDNLRLDEYDTEENAGNEILEIRRDEFLFFQLIIWCLAFERFGNGLRLWERVEFVFHLVNFKSR